MHKILHGHQQQGFWPLQGTGSRNRTEPATQYTHTYITIHTYLPVHYRPIFIKGPFPCERISWWNWTELAASYWTQWRGALCHILHTRRWHRTVNRHWEQPDPLQLDRTWEEQSVHQHCSAGCQLSWEVREECSISTGQPHTSRWVIHDEQAIRCWHCTFRVDFSVSLLRLDTTSAGPRSLPGPSSTAGNELLHALCMCRLTIHRTLCILYLHFIIQ